VKGRAARAKYLSMEIRSAVGRREADETCKFAVDPGDEEDVVVVERVVEAGGGVDGVLAEPRGRRFRGGGGR